MLMHSLLPVMKHFLFEAIVEFLQNLSCNFFFIPQFLQDCEHPMRMEWNDSDTEYKAIFFPLSISAYNLLIILLLNPCG